MRYLIVFVIAVLAVLLTGCNNAAESKQGSASTTEAPSTPANREADVVGTWTLDIDKAKFEPSADAQKELDKQPLGAGAVPALEAQLKEQLKDKLGDAVWTFNADKTVTVAGKSQNAKGTWSIEGDEVTMKTDAVPESKMTLSTDGKEMAAKTAGEQGTFTTVLKKG